MCCSCIISPVFFYLHRFSTDLLCVVLLCCRVAVLSEVQRQKGQCIYPSCGKIPEESSEKSFRCCALGVYCSNSCKEADWSRHKVFCEHSSVEEKLEGSKPTVIAKNVCASCGKKSDALKHCGRCMNISYCSKSCQQADWSRHKAVCQRSSTEEKLEGSKSTAAARDACAFCGKKSDAPMHCGWCMNISYCSTSCQQNDWSRHKDVCQSRLPHSKPEASTSVAETRDRAEVKRECSSCGEASESLKHCTRCRKVSYCGRSCQQADWPRHKSMCGYNEGKSEGVKPTVDTRDVCACCGKTSDTLKKCTGCRRVSYCDKNCQKAHRSAQG